MYLMLKDTKVLYFNFDEFVVEVINPELVPFCMRYAFKDDGSTKSLLYNIELLKSYLSKRLLSINRDNARKIYALFQIPRVNDMDTRVKACIYAKGVSIQDSYWIKADESNEKFDDVNIRDGYFKDISSISLLGDNPTATMNYSCPELTTHGMFRKAWVRYDDGLYLLKSDNHPQNINTKMEVLASKMLSCFDNKIECVKYRGGYRNTKDGKIYIDRCKNFVGEDYSFVEAWELIEYSNRQGISYISTILGFSKEAASIATIDFLLANNDRHTQNYGFLMSNETGEIVKLAPLFDFNLALVSDIYNRDNSNKINQMFNSKSTLIELMNFYKPESKLTLDMKKFKHLRKMNKEFDFVFDKVLERCKIADII